MLSAPVAGGSTMRCHTGFAWRAARPSGRQTRRGRRGGLDVEAEDGGVAILENVLLTLDAKLAGGTRLGPASGVDQLLPANHFGLDEASLKVAVDGSRRLRCARPTADRPCPALGLARGQEGDQAEDGVCLAGEPAQPGLLAAEGAEELVSVDRLALLHLGFDGGGDRQPRRAFRRRHNRNLVQPCALGTPGI